MCVEWLTYKDGGNGKQTTAWESNHLRLGNRITSDLGIESTLTWESNHLWLGNRINFDLGIESPLTWESNQLWLGNRINSDLGIESTQAITTELYMVTRETSLSFPFLVIITYSYGYRATVTGLRLPGYGYLATVTRQKPVSPFPPTVIHASDILQDSSSR